MPFAVIVRAGLCIALAKGCWVYQLLLSVNTVCARINIQYIDVEMHCFHRERGMSENQLLEYIILYMVTQVPLFDYTVLGGNESLDTLSYLLLNQTILKICVL